MLYDKWWKSEESVFFLTITNPSNVRYDINILGLFIYDIFFKIFLKYISKVKKKKKE